MYDHAKALKMKVVVVAKNPCLLYSASELDDDSAQTNQHWFERQGNLRSHVLAPNSGKVYGRTLNLQEKSIFRDMIKVTDAASDWDQPAYAASIKFMEVNAENQKLDFVVTWIVRFTHLSDTISMTAQ